MKWNSVLKTLLLAAMVATIPAAETQNAHVAAASASSQFLTAAIGADQLARTESTNNVANGTWTAGQKTTFHSNRVRPPARSSQRSASSRPNARRFLADASRRELLD
jgi:hypothetical protein